jgi:hypothetical protein
LAAGREELRGSAARRAAVSPSQRIAGKARGDAADDGAGAPAPDAPRKKISGALSNWRAAERQPYDRINYRRSRDHDQEHGMKYLLLAYGNEEKCTQLTQDEMAALAQKCNTYDEELQATGRVISGGSLDWASKSLRRKGGKLSITDGPFADTKEVVGGLIILEADDFEEAVRLASLHPAARMGEELGWGIELRPMEEECKLRAAVR